jgi:hypothetical protein
MNFLNYKNKPVEQEKDYNFLFQAPQDYEVQVDEEGNFLSDNLNTIDIPSSAYDSGEDIDSMSVYPNNNEPYSIGDNTSNENIPTFDMEANNHQSNNLDTIHDYNYDVYIPDAEHTLDYEPQYRDYLHDHRPSIDEEGEDVFNYNSYPSDSEPNLNDYDDYEEDDYEEDDYEEDDYEEDDYEEDVVSTKSSVKTKVVTKPNKQKDKYMFPLNTQKDLSPKEVKEAFDYLKVYSSMKEMNLAQKMKVLKEAGYSNTVITSTVSSFTIKEKRKNYKLNKFIDSKIQDTRLKKIFRENRVSLKEQKLLEGLTELNTYIVKQVPILLNLMKNKNPTFQNIENEDKRTELEGRFKIISQVIAMIPSLYTISIAPFVKDEEIKEKYYKRNGRFNRKIKPFLTERDRKRKNNKGQNQQRQNQQGQNQQGQNQQGQNQQGQNQQGQNQQGQDQTEETQNQKIIRELNTSWEQITVAITRLNQIIEQNTIKVTQKVGTLGKIKALAVKVGSKLKGFFKKAVDTAKKVKKGWDNLGDDVETSQIRGVNTKKI